MNRSPSNTSVEYRTCKTCGLTAPEGRHGMVDCVEHLKAQIRRLHRENENAYARAKVAEERLDEIRRALRD